MKNLKKEKAPEGAEKQKWLNEKGALEIRRFSYVIGWANSSCLFLTDEDIANLTVDELERECSEVFQTESFKKV